MNLYRAGWFERIGGLLRTPPQAMARLMGSTDYPAIHGTVRFYETEGDVLVAARVRGLPASEGNCAGRFFGFHIHEGGACTGEKSPFSDAGGHYNPADCEHPYHAGDLPPLLGASGEAFAMFLTDRFSLAQIIGKTVIVHDMPDDFKTQPAGDAGARIACGVIERGRG